MSQTMTNAVDAVVDAGGSVTLVGEVICWEMHGTKAAAAVRAALAVAGFDSKKFCPDFKPRNVFARVTEQVERTGRIVRKVREDAGFAHYQFNLAKKSDKDKTDPATPAVEGEVTERFDFPFEDIITLGKETGSITCRSDETKAHLEAKMTEVAALRTANDVTNIVQRLFDDYGKTNPDADLFPIRSGGSVYFVLERHRAFLDRVAAFVDAVGGRFTRFPVPVGTDAGNLSVKDTVENGLAALIREFDLAVASLDEASRRGTLDKAAERVELLREKIKCYEVYLGTAKDRLLGQVAESNKKLKLKVMELAQAAAAVADETAAPAALAG